ncbi:MAG TPA: hypothetical protein VK837_00340 [Longimicrobiales bacterium]|nr:hypothetical protein [Longimicrobiales bacterium]
MLITDFSQMSALATDQRRVYAATPEGIAVFDPFAERWLDPITLEDGYPFAADPTALAYDPFADELWLATVDGRILSYSPFFGRWRDEGLADAPPVFEIAFGEDVGGVVYLRESRGWSVLERGGLRARPPGGGSFEAPPRVGPDPLDAPGRRARGRTLTVDEAGRSWPITDAVTLMGSSDIWIGSYGGYLFRYGDFASDTKHFVYGVPGRGVGSVLATEDAVWFGGDGRGRRRGVARSDHNLDAWLQWDARIHGAPEGRVHDMASVGGTLWVAAGGGLYALKASGRWSRSGTREGLPADAARALAPAAGGLWVGTERGAVFVDGAGSPGVVIARGIRVGGLAVAGDDLWLATETGLLHAQGAATGGIGVAVRRAGDANPRLGRRTRSVAALNGAVYAAYDDGVVRVDDGSAATVPLGSAGREVRLRAAGGRLWIGGARGARGWHPGSGDVVRYDVGRDVPVGPVHDVAVGAGGVWLATPAGALLLRVEP